MSYIAEWTKRAAYIRSEILNSVTYKTERDKLRAQLVQMNDLAREKERRQKYLEAQMQSDEKKLRQLQEKASVYNIYTPASWLLVRALTNTYLFLGLYISGESRITRNGPAQKERKGKDIAIVTVMLVVDFFFFRVWKPPLSLNYEPFLFLPNIYSS